MRKFLLACTVTCTVAFGLSTTPALAQGGFDLGTLTNSLAVGSGGGAATTPPSSATVASFSYTPDMQVRKKVQADFIEGLKAMGPEIASQMDTALGQMDVFAEVDKVLQPYSMKTNDIADAYAIYLTNSWLGANGRTDDLTPQQMAGIQSMVRATMGGSKDLMALNESKKQSFAESLILQAVFYELMVDSAQADPAALTNVKAAIKGAAKELGIDVDQFELKPNGLIRKPAAK